jgi:hypothetical protein
MIGKYTHDRKKTSVTLLLEWSEETVYCRLTVMQRRGMVGSLGRTLPQHVNLKMTIPISLKWILRDLPRAESE